MLLLSPILCVGLSVGPESVLWQNGWIQMPFGVVSKVSRWMSVLDGVMNIEGKGQFWG